MVETLPAISREAFELSGNRGTAICLHGYTSTPYEVRTVADALHRAGFACVAPLLPGHGTTPRDMIHVRAEDWIASAEKALASADSEKPIFVVGVSMGALLATILASRHSKKIAGIALISPAFTLSRSSAFAVAAAKFGLYRVLPQIPKLGGADIRDDEGKRATPAYKTIPTKSLIAFQRLRHIAKDCTSHIKCPVFAAFGAQDHTVDTDKSLDWITHHCKAPHEQYIFQDSYHILTLDVDRDELCERVVNFCESIHVKKRA